jgi:ankyrin repeat protein/Leucine-rich repeat (LRR) protein
MAVSFDVEDTAFKALQLRDASKLNQLLESRQGLIRHPFKNRGGRTLVHLAAQDGCTLCLCKLLKTRGCNPDARSDYADGGQTALHLAAQSGRGECIKLLLEHNANPLIRDMRGQRTPLDIARSKHFARCVRLLEEGEVKYMKDNSQEEKLKQKLAAARSDIEDVCLNLSSQDLSEIFDKYDQMILRIVVFQQRNSSEDSLIFQLARSGHDDLVSACLEHLGQPPIRQSTSETLLHFACAYCNDKVVKSVFDHFPNMVIMADYHGSTPLHVLAAKNRPGLIKLLAKPNSHKIDTTSQVLCNLNALDEHGCSPLHVACAGGNLDVVKALLEQQTSRNETTSTGGQQDLNINCFAKTGRTPLHEAVWNGECELVVLLIKHGADVHALASPTVEAEIIIKKAAETAKEVTASLYFKSLTCRGTTGSFSSDSSIDYEKYNNQTSIDDIPICSRPRTFAIRTTNPRTTNPRSTVSRSLSNTASIWTEGRGSSNPFSGSQSQSLGSFCSRPEGRSRVESLSAAAVDFKKMKSQVTPLVEACVRGDREKVECLLQAGAIDKHGLALCVSMFQGFEIISQQLLSRPNGLRSRYSQGDCEGSQTNAIAVTWSGLGLVQINPKWVMESYLARSMDASQPYSLSDSVENAASPAVTPYFEPMLQITTSNSLRPITWLNLSSNKLLYIAAEVFKLENLVCLDMSNNSLSELPVDSGSDSALQGWKCCSLISLNVSRNALIAVPNCLWKLNKLVNINLAENRLSSLATDADLLPEKELITLKIEFKLKTLNVSGNCLQTLPPSLFFYPLLEELTASQNELETLPTCIWTAPALKSLDLSQNYLSCLPAESTVERRRETMSFHELLKSTNSGTLSHRTVTKKQSVSIMLKSSWVKATQKSKGIFLVKHERDNCLPSSFSSRAAAAANSLNPGENKTALSSYWTASEDSGQEKKPRYNCSGLTSLKLARNKFIMIPIGLPCLAPNLVNLDMSHNQMQSIGHPCSYPAQIQSLNLSRNQIETMDVDHKPSTVCYSIQGDDTSFSYQCSHQNHENLCALKTLNLKGNLLSSLCLQLPEAPYMAHRSGTVARDSMVELEIQHLRLLYPSLHRLDLANNNLKSVPAALGYQEELQFLDLQGNAELTDLPLELGRLKQKLFSLRLDADRMRVPPPRIAKGSAQQVLTYLYSLKQESAEHRQLKLTVVGYERRGKTSLVMRLRGVRASKQQASTKGVELAEWTLEEPRKGKGSPVTFITYDFAGQVEYYATHQCFLSEQSLYLVVWNSTGGEDEVRRIRQWLLNIEVRLLITIVFVCIVH